MLAKGIRLYIFFLKLVAFSLLPEASWTLTLVLFFKPSLYYIIYLVNV